MHSDACVYLISCPHGSNISHAGPSGVRQQAWYEDPQSISAKLNLARSHALRGIGLWTAGGVRSDTTPAGKTIWDAIASYAQSSEVEETVNTNRTI